MAYDRPELGGGTRIHGRIDSYQILRNPDEVLKGGANGLVHRAVAARTQKPVAIKLLSPREQKSSSQLETIRRLFKNELRKTRLVTHWGVVEIKDSGQAQCGDSEIPFMVMDLFPGDLQIPLQKGLGLLPGLLYCAVLSEAVEYINSRKLIHRDIKPENVLITADDSVQLSDLGIAEFAADFERDQFEAAGGYSEPSSDSQHPRHAFSPEQLKRVEGEKDVDLSRSDIFQLGLLFHKILLGISIRGQIRPNRGTYGNLPALIRDTIWNMLQQEPNERPPLEWCTKLFWLALDHRLRRLYEEIERLDSLVGATLNACFRDDRRFKLRQSRRSRWYPEFQWLSRNNYLRVDKDTVELTAAGIDLRNLALSNTSWQNFIRLYASLSHQPALSYEKFIRESKTEFYRYSARGLGWLPRSEPFACGAGKMVLAVLPAFYFRELHWVEVHMFYDVTVPFTIPFRSPVFCVHGRTRERALSRACAVLRRGRLIKAADERRLRTLKAKKGLAFKSFDSPMHLAAADAIAALCREKPVRVTIKWLPPNQYSIHVNGGRPFRGRLAEFRFSDLVRALVSARAEEIEVVRKPRVCVVRIREVSEFLRMILKFTGRLDQDFCVAPGPNHWRFFNVKFDFLADLRIVRNFIRAAEERKKVLRMYARSKLEF